MMRMRASAPSARAISTSCCSGIVRCGTRHPDRIVAPTRSSSSRARRRRSPQQSRRQRPPRLQTEGDVLRDGQIGKQGRLLINGGDAELRERDRIVVVRSIWPLTSSVPASAGGRR